MRAKSSNARRSTTRNSVCHWISLQNCSLETPMGAAAIKLAVWKKWHIIPILHSDVFSDSCFTGVIDFAHNHFRLTHPIENNRLFFA